MSMSFHRYRGESFAPFGYMLAVPSGISTTWSWNFDPVPNVLAGSLLEVATSPVSRLLGRYPGTEGPFIETLSTQPSERGYDRSEDDRIFGSYLGNIRTFSQALGFTPPQRIFEGEHRVLHANYLGDVGPDPVRNPFLKTGSYYQVWGTGYTQKVMPNGYGTGNNFNSQTFNQLYALVSLSGTTYPYARNVASPYPVRQWFSNQLIHLASITGAICSPGKLNSTPNGWFTWYYDASNKGYAYTKVSDLSIIGDQTSLSRGGMISLRYQVDIGGLCTTYQNALTARWAALWDCGIDISFDPKEPPRTQSISTGWHTLVDVGTLKFRVFRSLAAHHYVPPLSPLPSVTNMNPVDSTRATNVAVLCDWPSIGDTYSPSVPYSIPRKELSWKLGQFSRLVNSHWGDIIPSVEISTRQAMSQLEGNPLNNVENLLELKGIIDTLPDIRRALGVVSDVIRKDLSVETLKSIMDILTSENLRYNFGLRPTVDFLLRELPRLLRLNLNPDQITSAYRGEFFYEFPAGEFGRTHSSLSVRSKVVMVAPTSGVASAILWGRSTGLLPSPSKLWAVQPFSFVVDWFFQIEKRMDLVETALASLVYDMVSYVHTIRVDSPLDEAELLQLALKKSTIDPSHSPPAFRIFRREVSRHYPFLQSGKYDFGSPSRGPSWTIVGSLLYQLVGS